MKRLEKGFTLIELMIVVAIIAILAAVAGPKFGKQIAKAKDAKAVETVGTWRSALNLSYADHQTYETVFSTTLQAFADSKTISKTYSTAAKAALGTTASTAFTDAGTSSLSPTNVVSFAITGTAVEASIEFTSGSGNDTKGTAWNTY